MKDTKGNGALLRRESQYPEIKSLVFSHAAQGDDANEQLAPSFPAELLSAAIAKEFFGGKYDFDTMNFLERMVINRISGSDQNQSRILNENIARFANLMKNA